MTVRFIQPWNGYQPGARATLSNEATLIAGGIARADYVQDAPASPTMVGAVSNLLTGRVRQYAGAKKLLPEHMRGIASRGAFSYPDTYPSGNVTVTVNTNSTTNITGSVLRPTIGRHVGTDVAFASSDAAFSVAGVPASQLGIVAGTNSLQVMPGYIDGTTRFTPTFITGLSGSQIEFRINATSTGSLYRVWVNGRPLTQTMQATGAASGTNVRIWLQFAAEGSYKIELEIMNSVMRDVTIPATAGLFSCVDTRPVWCAVGDSITFGFGSTSPYETWAARTARQLDLNLVRLAIGGTGYIASLPYINRVKWLAEVQPSLCTVFGGWNDGGLGTLEERQQSVRDFFTSAMAACPQTQFLLIGMWSPHQNSWIAPMDQWLRAYAAEIGIPFVSLADPGNLTLTAAPYTAGTNYKVGEVVSYDGFAWSAVLDISNANATFNTAQWRCMKPITGTGNAGAATGDGNADVLIGSDGTHPTPLGHAHLGNWMSSQILERLTYI